MNKVEFEFDEKNIRLHEYACGLQRAPGDYELVIKGARYQYRLDLEKHEEIVKVLNLKISTFETTSKIMQELNNDQAKEISTLKEVNKELIECVKFYRDIDDPEEDYTATFAVSTLARVKEKMK